MSQALELNDVIKTAKEKFSSHPQKDQIIKRLRKRLCQENYSKEYPHINLHWGDTLWGPYEDVSEEEQTVGAL